MSFLKWIWTKRIYSFLKFEATIAYLCQKILKKLNFSDDKATTIARVFTENSLEGIYSHGVNRFSRFVDYIQKGYINPSADAQKVHANGCLEQWNGMLGPGITNAISASDRSMQLADKFGMGMVALANTKLNNVKMSRALKTKHHSVKQTKN